MYEIGSVAKVFGSTLAEYPPEAVVAAHDACALVMPHAYDAGPDQEVAQFLLARAMGADGVQTNQPAAIVAAAGEAVSAKLVVDHDTVCLVNADNGLGFPGKTVHLSKGRKKSIDLVTANGGCTTAPSVNWRGSSVSFAGDGAVKAANGKLT
ncbi:hypothetical protein AB0J82_27760 [Asanoa sp. NPDC049518]|uniref:hypothetical protein n=1 Tax=unclassified Asanoa TaxID=2685164 RepID=UPI003415ED84